MLLIDSRIFFYLGNHSWFINQTYTWTREYLHIFNSTIVFTTKFRNFVFRKYTLIINQVFRFNHQILLPLKFPSMKIYFRFPMVMIEWGNTVWQYEWTVYRLELLLLTHAKNRRALKNLLYPSKLNGYFQSIEFVLIVCLCHCTHRCCWLNIHFFIFSKSLSRFQPI